MTGDIMNRKTAMICLAGDVAMFVTLTTTGAPTWVVVTLGVLTLPVLIVAALPQRRQES